LTDRKARWGESISRRRLAICRAFLFYK